MSFPLSPANNQVTLENGISYTYNASRGAWFRTPATALTSLTSNTFTVLNSIIFSDGTSQTTAPTNIDSYARTTANTATNNIIIIQGVDTAQNTRMSIIEGVDVTQNTNITAINNFAQSAFNTANGANGLAAGAFNTANGANGLAAGAFNTANGANGLAQGAFNAANTKFNSSGGTITGSVIISANNDLTVTGNLNVLGNTFSVGTQTLEVVDPMIILGIGNYTTDVVDIGFVGHYNAGTNAHAGLIRDYATKDWYLFQGYTPELSGNNNVNISDASFDTANLIAKRITANVVAATVTIGGQDQASVDSTQNTNITAVNNFAASAFNTANGANGLAAGAFNQANTDFTNITVTAGTYGNTTTIPVITLAANGRITAVTNVAVTASGGATANLTSFTTTVDTFTGNGSQTEFTLSAVPDSEDNTFVFLNGVYQEKGTYSIAGANVVLTGVATANDTIEVTTVAGSIMNVSPTAYSTRIYQGNGSTNTFTISAGHTANTVMVFNNGVCQFPGDDYTVSGTTLTYVLTPQSDETIQIREMPIDKLVPLTQPVMRRYTANGVQTQFTVTAGQTANSMFVYENGICQVPVLDYTVSGSILTFVTAPVANVVVQIREMSI